MFRKSILASVCTSIFLATALGVMAIGSAATPAAAVTLHYVGGGNLASGAGPRLKPIEAPAGQLPRPQLVPTTRPSYCMQHNCILPPGNHAGP